MSLSEENFHQTGRSEEEQAPRRSNYSGSKIPSPPQLFPCLVATVIPRLTLALSWCSGGFSNHIRDNDIREMKRGTAASAGA